MIRALLVGFDDRQGGAELALVSLASAFDRSRVDPLVALAADGVLAASIRRAGVPVAIAPSMRYLMRGARRPGRAVANAVRFVRAARELGAIARQHRADVVHACVEPAVKFGALIARSRHPVRVCTFHEGLVAPYGRMHRRAIAACLRVGYDQVIVPSDASRAMLGRAGVPLPRLVTIRNGVTPWPPPAAGDDGARRRAELGLHAGDLLLVSVGRLTPGKGHAVLLDALARLRPEHPTLRGAIVGDAGTDEERRHEARLRQQCAALGLADAVRFVGWQADVGSWYRAADVFVHPSDVYDTAPLVIVEAMAAGLPVVASAVGGVPELVEDGRTGLLVPPSDPGALAAAIARVIDEPDRRRAMGQAAVAAAARRPSWAWHAAAITDVYARLLTARQDGTR